MSKNRATNGHRFLDSIDFAHFTHRLCNLCAMYGGAVRHGSPIQFTYIAQPMGEMDGIYGI